MKLEIEFEDDPNSSVVKLLNDWEKAVRGEYPPSAGFDELPEGHPDYANMHAIRQALIEKGIDPSTVYPIDCGFDTKKTLDEPITMVVTFGYKR
jgi:hypothetical protein